jgi:hypothetical protein
MSTRLRMYLASSLTGGIIGFAFGFAARGSNIDVWRWLHFHPGDAFVFTLLGALGWLIVYLVGLLHSR